MNNYALVLTGDRYRSLRATVVVFFGTRLYNAKTCKNSTRCIQECYLNCYKAYWFFCVFLSLKVFFYNRFAKTSKFKKRFRKPPK